MDYSLDFFFLKNEKKSLWDLNYNYLRKSFIPVRFGTRSTMPGLFKKKEEAHEQEVRF